MRGFEDPGLNRGAQFSQAPDFDMIRTIPTMNTARLTLRAMRPGDFDRFAQIWALPDVVRHLGGGPRSRAHSWSTFLRSAGHWQMTGFGQWAVEEQSTRRMIGQAGFFIRGQELGEDFDPFPEFGEVLVPRVQGNGYGWEAALAAHDWYDRVITGGLVTQVASDNAPALRVAWRLGYRALREIPGDGDTIVLMRRDRPIGTV